MKTNKYIALLAVLMIALISCKSKEEAYSPLFEMSSHQIDSLLTVTSQSDMTITERVNFYSGLFLGTPYNFKCVGDGPYAMLENWNLVNFKETNCMALCEHVLAMSISDSWDNFFNNLQQIRYKDGIIGMRTRNHYTMADWLPENSWIIDHVSAEIGGEYTKSVTRTISHTNFFKNKGINDLRYVIPDREIKLDYVPKENLMDIRKNTRPGDILSLIFADKTDIFSAHMLLIVEKDGKNIIRESSNSKMTTFDTQYKEWTEKIEESDRYIGVCFMRVKEELNTAGKVILPWDIPNLKTQP